MGRTPNTAVRTAVVVVAHHGSLAVWKQAKVHVAEETFGAGVVHSAHANSTLQPEGVYLALAPTWLSRQRFTHVADSRYRSGRAGKASVGQKRCELVGEQSTNFHAGVESRPSPILSLFPGCILMPRCPFPSFARTRVYMVPVFQEGLG